MGEIEMMKIPEGYFRQNYCSFAIFFFFILLYSCCVTEEALVSLHHDTRKASGANPSGERTLE